MKIFYVILQIIKLQKCNMEQNIFGEKLKESVERDCLLKLILLLVKVFSLFLMKYTGNEITLSDHKIDKLVSIVGRISFLQKNVYLKLFINKKTISGS